jgi:hypothetical protein
VIRLCSSQHDQDLIDLAAEIELSKRVNDDRNSFEFEELLGPVAAQPSSLPGGHNYRDIQSVIIRYR